MRRISWLTLVLISCVLTGCTSSSNSRTPSNTPATKDSSHPLYAFNLMREGSVLLQQGMYPEALKKFETADKHQPGNPTNHNMIGLCHLRLNRPEDALAAFDRAMNLVPSFTDARNNRGTAYLALQQYNLAVVDFLAVLTDTTYPHRSAVFYNLGVTYQRSGQTGAAEENFLKAATSSSPVYEAFLRLAEIAQESGRPESAIGLLEEATVKFPDRLQADLALGRLLIQMDREDEARPHLDKVIHGDPNSENARQARALLEEL
ncbi:MAG: tetratricopeptide repeat protein [bacterium]|nr:tetratricopeptide repeat protein [bacterium]